MERCIESLLPGSDRIEIILVDDGSTDGTASVCDSYTKKYPNFIKTVHQENRGHGGAINTGLRHASGRYFKVVDADDWVCVPALEQVLACIESFERMNTNTDMLICNYVYEHMVDKTQKPMRYTNVFPQDRIFSWDETGKFRVSQYLLMHSVFYRTQLLRDCDIELPEHTFYVDNLFVYQPLPFAKDIYYLNVDFYRYLIGREGQSVSKDNMVRRVNEQIGITKLMIRSHDLGVIKKIQPKLFRYMSSYLSMMLAISSLLLIIERSRDSESKMNELWLYLRRMAPLVYYKMRYHSLSATTVLPGHLSKPLILVIYHVARKVYHFN
jgi:glycosyltransferase involved in cell wall biosynthesis